MSAATSGSGTNAKCGRPVKWFAYRSRPEVTRRLPNDVFDSSSATQDFLSPGRFVRFSTCGAGSKAALLDEVPERVTRRLRCRSRLGMRPGILLSVLSRAQQNVIGRSMSKLRPWPA
jgi:hypothetical protein